MLWTILNKSWKQHSTKQQLHNHQSSIRKTINIRWTRYAEHCWRNKNELINDVLLWIPSGGGEKAGLLAYIQQLGANTGKRLEDLPWAMDDRNKWRERVREIRACSVTSWWYIYIYIYIYIYKEVNNGTSIGDLTTRNNIFSKSLWWFIEMEKL